MRIGGVVEIGIVFWGDSGMEEGGKVGKEIGNLLEDGKVVCVGFIFEGGREKGVEK